MPDLDHIPSNFRFVDFTTGKIPLLVIIDKLSEVLISDMIVGSASSTQQDIMMTSTCYDFFLFYTSIRRLVLLNSSHDKMQFFVYLAAWVLNDTPAINAIYVVFNVTKAQNPA